MLPRSLATLTVLLTLAAPAAAQIDARMFRYPDVSETRIAFVYAGDIWVVDKDGGTAAKLSSPPGEETFPRFSPDGSRIAFSGNYDGNTDVYVIPARGGTPTRVTHHPDGDRLLEWTPDGNGLLFASGRKSGRQRFNQLYTVPADGGLPERLPVPYGEFGTLSPDGRRLAYTPKSREFRTWKRYRGGTAPDVWLFDLETLESRNLTASDANEMQPMWHDRSVYFVSDRGPEQRFNLWRHDLEDGATTQVTRFADYDVSWPAIGPSDIVFQAGGVLYRLDLATEEAVEVPVRVVTDRTTLRPRTENVERLIAGADISPSGARAAFEARGQIFTVPAEHGVVRQLTHTSGAAERYPAWSPDGTRIAYWSDESGEYELTVRSADGSGEPRRLTSFGPGYRYRPFWDPDGDRVAFLDHAGTIRIYELETGGVAEVDRIRQGGIFGAALHPVLASYEVAWSPDGRWLAYANGVESRQRAIFLYDTRTGERHRATSGYYDDRAPSFDPEGRYLYYLTGRSLDPIYSDLQATWIYANTTQLVAAPLRRDVPSPLEPRNDEEGGEDEAEDEESEGGGPGGDEGGTAEQEREGPERESAPVEIDLEGFEARAVVLPPAAGNYADLRGAPGKLLYRRAPRTGAADSESPVLFWDLEEREEKTVLADADAVELSANREKLLVRDGRRWGVVPLRPDQKIEDPLATDELETEVDPKREWRQIFDDVWRTYRDYFYDPGMHGLDWDALREHYGALLDDAVTRWDVNFVIGELIGEVNASHTYVGGGDTETPPSRDVGLLGVDWALEDGAYRIERIVRGAPWDLEVRSPLDRPSLEVDEGDWVLAVNGTPLETGTDPYAAFEGLAEETVALTVNDGPTLEGAREVIVETIDFGDEARLRHLEWIEGNRRRVEEASEGRIGYVYVPNTGLSGQTELVRQLRSQVHKEGLIVDERFNSGGQLPDRFIEMFHRELQGLIFFRHAGTVPWPAVTHYGPKAMLINGWSGSGGDAFPWFFDILDVGPIIGERTWGGLIGPATGHATIDGGGYTAPPGRLYGPDGEWFAEGHGVDPDIPVVDDPSELARGVDPQLERAIDEVSRMLEEGPAGLPERPPFERRVDSPRATGGGEGGQAGRRIGGAGRSS